MDLREPSTEQGLDPLPADVGERMAWALQPARAASGEACTLSGM